MPNHARGLGRRGGVRKHQVLKPFAEAFWGKVIVGEGCWQWKSSTNGHGYGRIRTSASHTELAHRISWMMTNGEIPADRFVLHRCDNRRCVNPGHLFLGTYLDNNRDMVVKGRHWRHTQTHCKHGHPFSGENLYIAKKTGQRVCRTCRADSLRAHRGKVAS